MITRERIFGKKEPNKYSRKIYIICEGAIDEPKYYGFYEGLSSNLNVITIPSEEGETDPDKLAALADNIFFWESNRYSLDYTQGDRIWFVVDTDRWEKEGKIARLRDFCKRKNGEMKDTYTELPPYMAWNTAQSNPCFEIWLYYHIYSNLPEEDEVQKAASFKQYVNDRIVGGFNYGTDPVRLKNAIENAEANYKLLEDGHLALYATELLFLGKEIYGFVSDELEKLYNKLR